MNLKDKRFLFYDFGLFLSMAQRLARDVGEVGYFVPHENSFSDGRELIVGSGLEGITRVVRWDEVVDNWDCLVFPDVLCSDLQEYYRRQGKRVWGAGPGADLELKRWETKQRNNEAGLPENECYRVKGTSALRQFFIDHEESCGWYVKVSGLRGLGETWCARNYADARGQIDEIDFKHAPLSYNIHFIVEAAIPDCNEIGYDGYCIGGQFPNSSLWGIESKDKCYFGMVCDYNDLPSGVHTVNDALSSIITDTYPTYAQFLSTEIREQNGEPHPIDYTCRHASPAGECLCENMANLAEVIWAGAEGKLVEPEWKHQYCAQILLTSEPANYRAIIVDFPEETRDWVKLYNHCRMDDEGEIGMADYVVPQIEPMKELGSVVAIGDDPDETIALCKERAESVKGFKVKSESESLDKAAADVLKLSEVEA